MHGKSHASSEPSYIPAAGKDWLLPLYDPLVALLMRNDATRGRLVAGASIAPGHRVLDLGCGTGSLTVLIHERHPEAVIAAIDPDPLALARAEAKAKRAQASVRFERAFGNALPFPDASFDRVLSSLVLHHLTREVRLQTLAEVRRVLAPDGSLHVLDFGPPRSAVQRALGAVIHHGSLLDDHRAGRIPEQMRAAGFAKAFEEASIATAFGSLSIYRAEVHAPAADAQRAPAAAAASGGSS